MLIKFDPSFGLSIYTTLLSFKLFRYTSRRAFAIDHFMQALAIDPLLWAAYEELCVLGQCWRFFAVLS